ATLLIEQFSGRVEVTTQQLALFVGGVLLLGVLVVMIAVAGVRSRRGRSRVDSLARSMARAKDFNDLTDDAQQQEAEKLRAQAAGPGVPLARLVNDQRHLRASWEWVQTWIMGPRAGKTSCVCVPQVIETDGPVLATSNKRDLVDLTRGPRSEKGVVWVQDRSEERRVGKECRCRGWTLHVRAGGAVKRGVG